MIQVEDTISADNTNVLAGTDLATAPGPGLLEVYLGSTQADTIVNVSAPPTIPARGINPMLRANGAPVMSDQSPFTFALNGGEAIIINVDIITAATFGYICRFFSADELAG